MASVMARSIAAGVSTLAGVAGGVITNVWTDGWKWPWAVALGATTLVMVVTQVWLTRASVDGDVSAVGRGAIAAGDTVRGDIDIVTKGRTTPPGATPPPGTSANGHGVIAAGRNVKGKIRIRSTER